MQLVKKLRSSAWKLIRHAAQALGFEISRLPLPIRSDQLWQPWLKRLARDRPISVVFDVGANRGQTVGWFRPFMPQAQIHAFEPFTPVFKELIQATQTDAKVKCHQIALGDRKGSATLYENSVDTTNSLLPNSDAAGDYAPKHMIIPRGEYTVPLERMDEFCAREGISTIDLLKIDAQGYEGLILRGAGDMLRPDRIRGIYIEILFVDYYKGQSWGGELIELLRSRGYRFWGIAAASFDEKQGWRWADALFIGEESAA